MPRTVDLNTAIKGMRRHGPFQVLVLGAVAAACAAPAASVMVAKASGDRQLIGRVTRDGGPVSGAHISVVRFEPTLLKPVEEPICDCEGIADELVAVASRVRASRAELGQAVSDASGAFVVSVPASEPVVLLAKAGGNDVAIAAPGANTEEVALQLESGIMLEGRVKLESEQAGDQANVNVLSTNGFFAETKPKPDGTFTIGPVPRAEYWLLASCTGLLPDWEMTRGRRPAEITLHRGRTLVGFVHDGPNLVSTKVDLVGGRAPMTVQSAKDGRFQFDGVRPGSQELQARTDSLFASQMIIVPYDKTPPEVVHLQLGPPRFVVVRVMGKDGLPVVDAKVQLSASSWFRRRGTTGRDGIARVGPVPPGSYSTQVYSPKHVEPRAQEAKVDNEDVRQEFVLHPAAPARGTLTDASGKPVGGAEIMASPEDRSRELDEGDGVGLEHTRPDGTFDISNLTPGPYRFRVSHPDHVPLDVRVSVPAPDLRLIFPAAETLVGAVIDPENKPKSDVQLLLQTEGPEPVWVRVETDSKGEYVLHALPGEYQVEARIETHYGHSDQKLSIAPERISVRPGKNAPLNFRLTDSFTLGGRVTDSEGAPVVGVEVFARPEGSQAWPDVAAIQPDGAFLIRLVPEGKNTLSARAPGYEDAQALHVAAGTKDVVLKLRLRGLVKGRVLDSNSKPVSGFVVNFEFNRSTDGAFSVPVKKASPMDLLIRSDGFAAKIVKVTARAEAITPVGDIRLEVGRTITGVVKDGAGPVAGALVRLGEGRMPPVQAVKTSASGSFVLQNVPSEPTTVLVEDERYLPAEIPIAPTQNELSIQLRRGARVAGTFLDKSGQPLAGAVVLSYSVDRELRSVVDSKGAFELSGLDAGSWLIQTYVPGASNPWSAWKVVKVGPDEQIKVDLREGEAGPELRVLLDTPDPSSRLSIAPGTPRDPTNYLELRAIALDIGDSEGGSLRPVPPGTYTLFLWSTDNRFRVARHVIKVDARPKQEIKVRMKLPPPSMSKDTLEHIEEATRQPVVGTAKES